VSKRTIWTAGCGCRRRYDVRAHFFYLISVCKAHEAKTVPLSDRCDVSGDQCKKVATVVILEPRYDDNSWHSVGYACRTCASDMGGGDSKIRFLEVKGSLDREDAPYPDGAVEESFAVQYDDVFDTIVASP